MNTNELNLNRNKPNLDGLLGNKSCTSLINTLGVMPLSPKSYYKDVIAVYTSYLSDLMKGSYVDAFTLKSLILGERLFINYDRKLHISRESLIALNIISQRHFDHMSCVIRELYGLESYDQFIAKKPFIESWSHGMKECEIPEHLYKGARRIMRSVEYQENRVIEDVSFQNGLILAFDED